MGGSWFHEGRVIQRFRSNVPSFCGSTHRAIHFIVAAGLIVVLAGLGGAVAWAEVSASMHMSVSPGGGEVLQVQSGTAKVFAVVDYRDAAETKLTLRVLGAAGALVFEHYDTYDGSGQDNIEISGKDILTGYVAAAQAESGDLEEAMSLAKEASTSSAKRVRTATVVAAAQSLKYMLPTIRWYQLEQATLDQLDVARDLADQVETKGNSIYSSGMEDDELDSALDELEGLVDSTIEAVDQAVKGVDTDREWPLADGPYTSSLLRNGQVSVGFDWEVSPDGTPGTPAPDSSGQTPQPSATPVTPTSTSEPSATPTARPATSTPRPTSTSVRAPTPTPVVSSRQQSSPTPAPVVQPTATPVSSPATNPPAPVPQGEATSPAPEIGQSVEVQARASEQGSSYPAPESTAPAPAAPDALQTPAVQALRQEAPQPAVESRAREPESRIAGAPNETPLAPQETRELPITRIISITSALVLGLIALWLRARV